MKSIGIVTFHRSYNYGSVLIAYAMSKVLSSLGLEVKIIDYRHPATKWMYEPVWWRKDKTLKNNLHILFYSRVLRRGAEKRKSFTRFIENELPLTKRYESRHDIKEHFDYLVCGSDQIWNPKAPDSHDPIYFLDFGSPDTVKFSYGASSGSQDFVEGYGEQVLRYLSGFTRVGVRENMMKNLLAEKYRIESAVNPDPTLLIDREEWESLEKPVEGIPDRYLLVYTLRDIEKTIEFATTLSKRLEMPVIHINHLLNLKRYLPKKDGITLFETSPGQFLYLIHNASCIVSNSFHGNVFSIIFRKDFVYPIVSSKVDERIVTLYNRLGLGESRMLGAPSDYDSLQPIDYDFVHSSIRDFGGEGLDFFKECLK